MAKDQITGYLLTSDLTARFGVTKRAVYLWVEKGHLHPSKIGNTLVFDPAEVARFKTERKSWTRGGKREKRAE